MEKVAERPPGEICHRCLQPIAPNAQRCRNCGERHSPANRIPIFLGVLGLLALAFLAMVMLKVIRNTDIDSAPPAQTEESTAH
jgi:predicted amidophosphoribosyltransferase